MKNLALPSLVDEQQADALLTDSFEAVQFLTKYKNLTALPEFGRDRKAYMVSRLDGEWRSWLDNWLEERERDSFFGELRHRWLGQPTVQAFSSLTALLALLDLRLALMPAVADYKYRYALPIEDLQQEAAVIQRATILAREKGKNSEAMQEFFRVQIDLAKRVQQFVIHNPEHMPKWARGFSLASDIRPVLSELNEQIALLFMQVAPASFDYDAVIRMAEEEIVTEGVTVEEKRRLGEIIGAAIQQKK